MNQSVGNLCKHTLEYHGGASVYYDTYNGTYVIYYGLRWHIMTAVYANRMGVSIFDVLKSGLGGSIKDFKHFTLDHEKMKTIRRDILEMRQLEQIINRNIIENQKYLDGYY